jgi:uncharacterized membrane protein HdeD (DUF308 family)
MTFGEPDPSWTAQKVADSVRRRTFWMEALGGALVLLGLVALAFVVVASFVSTILLGALLVASGAAQIGASFGYWRRRGAGFGLGIILGGLCLVSGLLCLANPAASLMFLTLILGSYFIASGLVRVWIAVRGRFPGWGWGVTVALAEFLLGTLTLAGWPNTSLFVLGTLLGIQLISSGVIAFTLGATVRSILGARGGAAGSHRPATRFQH